MMIDVVTEIKFKTARSGGKGGQNVNKVETMVEGYWHIDKSKLVDKEQKIILQEKLVNKINANGNLLVKSQKQRTQLGNKQEVVKKINHFINKALIPVKLRKPSKPSKVIKEKRLENKRQKSTIKDLRKKISKGNW